jgi:hypothetical protein
VLPLALSYCRRFGWRREKGRREREKAKAPGKKANSPAGSLALQSRKRGGAERGADELRFFFDFTVRLYRDILIPLLAIPRA